MTRARLWLIEGCSPDLDLFDECVDNFAPREFQYAPVKKAWHEKRKAQRAEKRAEKTAADAAAEAKAAAPPNIEALVADGANVA